MSEMLATRARRATIVECFKNYVEAHPNELLSQKTVCEAIRVNEASLRRACKQRFGIGPNQYARKYRMQLARLALLTSDPAGKTVTQIAVDFGFTHLGRFSVIYREMFGESPSATLHAKLASITDGTINTTSREEVAFA
jgi:AraC-like DNA-binding protein